jgi:ATP phosphoribosyltransferase
MSERLILAVPSKGRLQEQTAAFFADSGLAISQTGGARGYGARIAAAPEIDVRLASAGDIARALVDGEIDLGVTGEDVLREAAGGGPRAPILVKPLGFGGADLVVAVSAAWLDVETVADLIAVAEEVRLSHGRRLRIATKYHRQARDFFAAHGFADYRLVDSAGATEGAPAAGAADAIVDITTTGATLAANGLKILADGVILKSQACLFARNGAWGAPLRAAAQLLLDPIEARGAAKALRVLSASKPAPKATLAALAALGCDSADGRLVHCPAGQVNAAVAALQAAACSPVSVAAPDFVYAAENAVLARFLSALDESATA